MDDIRRLQGKRLKEVRKLLGKTQETFTEWLTEHGLTGNYNEPYKAKTVAAWESGRRVIPNDIKMALSQNVAIDGHPVQYAYLNGDTDFITQSVGAIVKATFESLNSVGNQPENWVAATPSDISELANSPINKFALLLFDELLPIYNYGKKDIWDKVRFNLFMYQTIQELIEDYIAKEHRGE